MKQYRFLFLMLVCGMGFGINSIEAQQYKFKQSSSIMGMKTETTVFVKGMRKRTEPGAMMVGMPATPITIEQCDLQRTIKVNDKKKLYFIEPFNKETAEIDEDTPASLVKEKPVPKSTKPKEKVKPVEVQKGGTITSYYAIIDTGERKMMHGFNARHIWTVTKMMPSPNACSMKDSMVIKTDGWYIDLPKFNCPINTRPNPKMMRQMQGQAPEENNLAMPACRDSFISRHSGKGKLGFALSETRTMKMGSNTPKTDFTTSIETLEFSTAKIDSMLFEIPIGYTEAKNEDELRDKMNVAEMMKEAMSNGNANAQKMKQQAAGEKAPGGIRIGVYAPTGDEQVDATDQQSHLAEMLTSGKIDAVTITSEEDAKKQLCDYTLTTTFTKIKAGGKLGGMLKAIKNMDPDAASTFSIAAKLLLTKLSDGSTTTEQKVDDKYDGKINDAAKKAMEEGSRRILKALK